MDHFVFAIFITIYYVLHSFLASNIAKGFANQKLGLQKFYRIIYNFIAVFSFLLLVYFYRNIEKRLLFEMNTWTLILGIALFLFGLCILFWAFRGYDKAEFIGYDAFQKKESKTIKLNTKGLNKYVRHPLYLGTFFIVWSLVLLIPNFAMLIIAVITTLYIFIGAKLEEEKLISVFGIDYIKYQKTTPMIFPIKW